MRLKTFLPRIILSSLSLFIFSACSSSDTTAPQPGPARIAVDSLHSRAYVTNFNTNNVSVIDTANNTVLTKIGVGMNPVGVVVFPVVSKAYVANNASGTVSVIDTGTNKVIATVPAGSGPFALAPLNTQVYVTGGSAEVNVINTVNDTNAGSITDINNLSIPTGIGVHSGTSLIYIVNRGFNNVVVMDTSFSFGPSIPVGNLPSEIAVDSGNDRAYVTNNGDPQTSPGNTVTVIKTTDNSVVTTVTVGSAPDGVDVDALNNKTYVANSLNNTVSVIDNTNNTVVTTIPVGAGPAGVAVDSGNSLAYITNFDDNTVSVIDTTTDTVIATIHI